MSPGAIWKPFTITAEEYNELKIAVASTPISEIELYAGCVGVKMKIDSDFDYIQDHIQWLKAICKKHKQSWYAELKQAGKMHP